MAILSKKEKNVPEPRTLEIIVGRISDSVLPLYRKIEKTSESKISPLFSSTNFSSNLNTYQTTEILKSSAFQFDEAIIDILKRNSLNADQPQILMYVKTFLSYQKNGINDFNVQLIVKFVFEKYMYKILFENDPNVVLEKLNSEPLSDEEVDKVVNIFGKKITEQIKENVK